ncbi:MAG TPA: hypothetical protein VGC65_07460 [Bacteroidia bacterium]
MKQLLKFFPFFLCLLWLSSCKKYEDGPAFSLMTKKARIANIWKVDKYLLNGEDKTSSYRLFVTREKLVIYQSGEFSYNEISNWSWAAPAYTGSWKFVSNKEEVEMTPENTTLKVQTYKILRLKKDELWLERQVSPDSLVEYRYLPESIE